MNSLVTINDQKVTTTSNIIADVFQKRHDNVLRAIERLECSEEFTRLNFEASSYQDSTGRMLPCFKITRDGFSFLAMGFTGKKPAQFKEEFINQFNKMEKILLDGTADIKRYEFNHHRSTNAPGGLDMKYTLAMADTLKDIPPVPRLIALQELTGRDLSKAIAHLKQPVKQHRDAEMEGLSQCLDTLLDEGEDRYGFRTGHNGMDNRYIEGDPYEVGTAIAELAKEQGLEEMLENLSRFHARLRDKHLLKKVGWSREHSGVGSWQTVRYTKQEEV